MLMEGSPFSDLMKRILLLVLFAASFCFLSPSYGLETVQGLNLSWKALYPGISFLRWPVQGAEGPVNSLAIVRIDPEQWTFRVFFNKEPKSAEEWQKATGASVICNGGFYQENFAPAGRILVNGSSLGPFKNRNMKAMFLAEPKKGFEKLPKATIIDLKDPGSEEIIASYDQGIQSFPVLLDPKGQVRVNPSSFQASRTAIALDRSGVIYLLITEKSSFTLFDLGNYLKGLPLGFQFVLNLDGGLRSQLLIRVGAHHYHFSGQNETSPPTRFFFPDPIRLPSVIGLFPRALH
jgi:uncharacterized protein YigE (DUF2233 family)